MGYVWTDDPDGDDGNDGGSNGQQGSPAQLPAPARKHMRKLEQELAELKKERDTLRLENRTKTASELVKAKGYNPAIAALIPSTVDGQEAVDKWLDDNAALFAKVDNSGAGTGAPAGNAPPDTPPEMQQALAALHAATNQAMTPERLKDINAQLQAAQNPEALLAIMRANGAKV